MKQQACHLYEWTLNYVKTPKAFCVMEKPSQALWSKHYGRVSSPVEYKKSLSHVD